jgi:predicted alpha/beta-hydrolase family hydrolase
VHIRIEAGNEQLSAYHFLPACDDLASAEGKPCVVMAHGIGATQDCGLTGFAENLAAIGCHAIAFDYRHLVNQPARHGNWSPQTSYPSETLFHSGIFAATTTGARRPLPAGHSAERGTPLSLADR